MGVVHRPVASLAAGAAAGAIVGGLAALAFALIYPQASRSSFEFGLLYTVTRHDQALPLAGLGFAIARLPLPSCIASMAVFALGIPLGGLASDSIASVLNASPWIISGMFLVAPICCTIVGIALVMPLSVAMPATPLAALLLGGGLGLVISFSDASAAASSFAAGAVLSGLWLTVPPIALWRYLERPWFSIASRIFGAWLIAIGAILIAAQLIPPRSTPQEPTVEPTSLSSPGLTFQ